MFVLVLLVANGNYAPLTKVAKPGLLLLALHAFTALYHAFKLGTTSVWPRESCNYTFPSAVHAGRTSLLLCVWVYRKL